MSRDLVNAIADALPGVERSDPWGGGHDVWKVGDKIFAAVGMDGRGVTVKCRDTETAQMLIDAGVAEKAPYFHRSWVLLPFGPTSEDEFRHRIESSYALIRDKLPKKLRAALG